MSGIASSSAVLPGAGVGERAEALFALLEVRVRLGKPGVEPGDLGQERAQHHASREHRVGP